MNPEKQNEVGPQNKKKDEKSNVLVPVLGVTSLIGAFQVSTQYFASTYNYHQSLGPNIAHIYPPWAIVQWSSSWYETYPNEFMKAGSMGLMFATAGLLGVAVLKIVGSNSSKANTWLHGSARWAKEKDIRQATLLPRKKNLLELVTGKDAPTSTGVYVGAWRDEKGALHYLRHNGPEHVLTYAPTRSGKGIGLVIPTLLSWPASAVITDLKGELWALTAGWRQKYAKNKVMRFEPASLEGSVQWNPLDEIRIGTEQEVGDVQNLASLIVDPDGKGLESHWAKTAYSLLTGVILHAIYKAKNDGEVASLPSVDRMLSEPDRDISELWMEMVTYSHKDGENNYVVGSSARDMMDRPEEEAGSVLSTAKSFLSLYRDPVVARNVSRSDFRIKDLMHADDPASLYIVTQPNDKTRLRPIVRIMVNMVVRLLADKMDFENGRPVAHYNHRLLAMLDEFPSLGKLEIMQESLAFIAGYGIKAYIICQDINQLRSRETGYGHDEAITSSCQIQNAFPPNRIETADHLSRLTGQTTIVKEQITTSGRRTAAMQGQASKTYTETGRALLTADEAMRMPGPKKDDNDQIVEAGDMVVYVSGYPAIYGEQPLYFKDPVFRDRAAVPAPKVSDRFIEPVDQEGVKL